MFKCKACGLQSEYFHVYTYLPQRRCVHCVAEYVQTELNRTIQHWDFTGHPTNCLFFNKKREPVLRELLRVKQWIPPSEISGTRKVCRTLRPPVIKQIWGLHLWDNTSHIVLNDDDSIYKKKGRSSAGIAKLLSIPMVEFQDVASYESLLAGRFGAQGILVPRESGEDLAVATDRLLSRSQYGSASQERVD